MKKIIVIVILIIIGYGLFYVAEGGLKNSASPNFGESKTQKEPQPTSIPSPTPKTFQFEGKTDLKMELEEVNPVVMDSDF